MRFSTTFITLLFRQLDQNLQLPFLILLTKLDWKEFRLILDFSFQSSIAIKYLHIFLSDRKANLRTFPSNHLKQIVVL